MNSITELFHQVKKSQRNKKMRSLLGVGHSKSGSISELITEVNLYCSVEHLVENLGFFFIVVSSFHLFVFFLFLLNIFCFNRMEFD